MLVVRFIYLISCVSAFFLPPIQGNNRAQGNNQARGNNQAQGSNQAQANKAGSRAAGSQSQNRAQTGSYINPKKSALNLSNQKYIEHEDNIPYQYIVKMKSGLSDKQVQMHISQVNKLQSTVILKYPESHPFFQATARFKGAPSKGGIIRSYDYSESLRLYLGYFVDEVISDLKNNALVANIEQALRPLKQVEIKNSKSAATTAVISPKSSKSQSPIGKRSSSSFSRQPNAPWHLGRLNWLSTTRVSNFFYYTNAGSGVDIYVMDSAVNGRISDLSGRVSSLGYYDIRDNHGTCVASIAAGQVYGVAKKAHVISLYLNFDLQSVNFFADVLQNLQYIFQAHISRLSSRDYQGSVVNLSFRMGSCQLVETILQKLNSVGVHVVAAAGNFKAEDLRTNPTQDSCHVYPASSPYVLTVGASDYSNNIAQFSGRGPCVDLYAPGQNVGCASYTSWTASEYSDGTSMAAPIVTGIIASLLSYAPDANSGFRGTAITPMHMKYRVLQLAKDFRSEGSLPVAYLGDTSAAYMMAYGIQG